jgi:putative molybdopterin biosynthesis protein
MSNPPHIHLRYAFEPGAQAGASIDHPLFDTLAALQAHGSIKHAAEAMGLSYRYVWGALRKWEEELGEPLVLWNRGMRATLTPYALRLMWAERQARVRMAPHLEALRSELQHAFQQAGEAGFEVVQTAASHDLALPRLQGLAARRKVHLSINFAGSADALRALNEGRCQLAGFHVPRLPQGSTVFAQALRPLLKPGLHKLIGSHSRLQGLMYGKSCPDVPTWQNLCEGRLRFVNRQTGSGTRLLLEHLAQAGGNDLRRIDGYETRVEDTHMAVAATVASGQADVGLGVEAAAREFGLGFVPLAQEDYYLVCLKPALDSPAATTLREVLASRPWADAVAGLAGCSVQRGGEVLSLTHALPWWDFARPRRRGKAQADTAG